MNQLEIKIINASNAYYAGKKLLLTDDQFDTALKQLEADYPNSPILKRVGFGYKVIRNKVKHRVPFTPIKKRTRDITKIKINEKTVITEKLDGISVTVDYLNGTFVRAVTRGDEIEGMDISQHVAKMVPHTIKQPYKGYISLKGEAVIAKDIFKEKYSKEYSNGRNFVAGKLNSVDPIDETWDIRIVFYIIQGGDKLTKEEELNTIKATGLDIVRRTNSIEGIEAWSKVSKYLTDGVVVTNHDESIILKFESEIAEAIVDHIEWNVGSSGKVTPLCILSSPVELGGSMIRKLTLHNYCNVIKHNIGNNSIIEITKAHEIIPQLVSVIRHSAMEFPTVCPICEETLEVCGPELKCTNASCPVKQKEIIKKFISLRGIPDGVGGKRIDSYLKDIDTLEDYIISLKVADSFGDREYNLKNSYGDHVGSLLYSIECTVSGQLNDGITFQEFWYILNLPGLARTGSKKLKNVDPRVTTIAEIALNANKMVIESLRNNEIFWRDLSGKIKIREGS